MYLITQLLLPYLDVDSMAALLETCKEAHSAFQPVEIDSRPCHNRGLAERLGHKSKRNNSQKIGIFGSQLVTQPQFGSQQVHLLFSR